MATATRTKSKAAPPPVWDPAKAYIVRTPNERFAGERAGIGFSNGEGRVGTARSVGGRRTQAAILTELHQLPGYTIYSEGEQPPRAGVALLEADEDEDGEGA